MKRIRVLIVDDDEDDFLLTTEHLKEISGRAFDIEWAANYEKGLHRIKECEHDVYIIDYFLGPHTGLKLIREALEAQCEEPMILLTGLDNPEIDVAAAELGAFDYMLKGSLTPDKLERSIRYSLAQAAIIKSARENERKYRTVFEKSRDMIFISDFEGRILSISNSAMHLTGYSQEELLAMHTSDLYADKEEGKTIEHELILKGEIADRKIEILCKNGERRICLIYATLQSDRNNQFYCQGVVHDLSAKIQEERAILRSEKMEATGRLMRMLAHEVRNPLTNIGLALESIRVDLPEENEITECLDIIKRNTKRIEDLISQLLNSSRPTELKRENWSLREIILETLEETNDRLKLKNITLKTNFTKEDDIVFVDKEKIKIAFTNIIVNAIEAMKLDHDVLEVSVKKTFEKLVVSICDTGEGISPENMNRLFEPYFTNKPNGLGLGLAGTLNIIQSHGANIDVESKVGEGTTFFITFQKLGDVETTNNFTTKTHQET